MVFSSRRDVLACRACDVVPSASRKRPGKGASASTARAACRVWKVPVTDPGTYSRRKRCAACANLMPVADALREAEDLIAKNGGGADCERAAFKTFFRLDPLGDIPYDERGLNDNSMNQKLVDSGHLPHRRRVRVEAPVQRPCARRRGRSNSDSAGKRRASHEAGRQVGPARLGAAGGQGPLFDGRGRARARRKLPRRPPR